LQKVCKGLPQTDSLISLSFRQPGHGSKCPQINSFMKAKYALALLFFGYAFDFIGSLLKILHQHLSDPLLILAAFLKVSGAILLLYKILHYPKWKDFFNR
jgi:hypothetical protein